MKISFYLNAQGIGDAICGMYAACGIANQGHEVVFHTKHGQWLPIEHPNLLLKNEDEPVFDANWSYDNQTRQGYLKNIPSRIDWYIKNLAHHFNFESCDGARPKTIKINTTKNDFVLLAPFSADPSRTWLKAHWRKLAIQLLDKGLPVYVLAQKSDMQDLHSIFYELPIKAYYDKTPQEVMQIIADSKLIIGGDSGPAHLAGLFQTPFITLTAQYPQEFVFNMAINNHAVPVSEPCSYCFTRPEAGYDYQCVQICSVLQAITPTQVAKKVYEMLDL